MAIVLAVALALVVWVWRRARARAEETEREHIEARRLALEEQESAHSHEIHALNREVIRSQAIADRFQQFAADLIGWELASRDLIGSVCDELGVNGVLATNVTFVPSESSPSAPFVTQVDHVLLTESGGLVIESKNWRGVVFDGRLPSSVHPAFGMLVPDDRLAHPFAVQLSRESTTGDGVKVLVRSGGESPRTQVRAHARRLSQLVQREVGRSCWFNTSVLYSHPEVQLYAKARSAADGPAETAVVAGRAQLRSLIAGTRQPSHRMPPPPLEETAAVFERLGADLRGLGTYAQRWVSVHAR